MSVESTPTSLECLNDWQSTSKLVRRMPWATLKSSKNDVDRAAAIIMNPPPIPETSPWTSKEWEDLQAWENAYAVISNWRSAHGYPLWGFQSTLRNKINNVDHDGLVSQRLKRFAAIRLKLRLHPNMALSQMQDIGGCRAVVHSIEAARDLAKIYESSSLRHTLRRRTDYIESPRHSGYRGIHLIYRYRGRHPGPYDSFHIEMQIRTEIQHIWATAVETVGTFLSQALKSSQGQDVWLRFFALMGSAVALREGADLVADTRIIYKT
jgi:putative GTP pyrophosphokinase